MINVTKSPSPNRNFSYKENVIRLQIRSDFHCMCYLCEEVTRHYEIDHFYPKEIYPHLINEWNNLFLICQKCNKIRPKKINTCKDDEVLDNCEDDVESLLIISYDMDNDLVNILPNTTNPQVLYKVENTIKLLNRIYNGVDTQSLSYIDLRDDIKEELTLFNEKIEKYQKFGKKHSAGFKRKVIRALSKKSNKKESSFVSFKRYIIKTQSDLKEFEQYFD